MRYPYGGIVAFGVARALYFWSEMRSLLHPVLEAEFKASRRLLRTRETIERPVRGPKTLRTERPTKNSGKKVTLSGTRCSRRCFADQLLSLVKDHSYSAIKLLPLGLRA